MGGMMRGMGGHDAGGPMGDIGFRGIIGYGGMMSRMMSGASLGGMYESMMMGGGGCGGARLPAQGTDKRTATAANT